MSLIQTLRQQLQQADAHQAEIARATGIPESTLSRFQNSDDYVPNGRTLEKLAIFFGLELAPKGKGSAKTPARRKARGGGA